MAVPPGLGPTAAIRESGRAVEAIQAERLQVAAGLDQKRIQELRDAPQFRLPDYAAVPGGDPREVTKARHHALDVVRQPLFTLSSPGSRELRNGFAASFDRAVFATFDGDLLEPLLASRRGREEHRLGEPRGPAVSRRTDRCARDEGLAPVWSSPGSVSCPRPQARSWPAPSPAISMMSAP